ncbi:phiSA1p31-related protein [Streptomyces sp. NPDC058280]|uniref:phiSA1p31-related protein n=1 Tax=Streptomyces sp. NPDC058280 TaxID=3346419 RepID=UPI0036EFAFBA
MATAQYETRTRTMVRIFGALEKPAPPAAPSPETLVDTFTYGGIAYEMGALYRDQDGDCFKFETPLSAEDDTPRGRIRNRDGGFGGLAWTLAAVAGTFGPLTKVTS